MCCLPFFHRYGRKYYSRSMSQKRKTLYNVRVCTKCGKRKYSRQGGTF